MGQTCCQNNSIQSQSQQECLTSEVKITKKKHIKQEEKMEKQNEKMEYDVISLKEDEKSHLSPSKIPDPIIQKQIFQSFVDEEFVDSNNPEPVNNIPWVSPCPQVLPEIEEKKEKIEPVKDDIDKEINEEEKTESLKDVICIKTCINPLQSALKSGAQSRYTNKKSGKSFPHELRINKVQFKEDNKKKFC